ncbi:MAG: nicotinate (nicotinamide) nucleotide adenylyltransferase [Bryobacterales bacterium]
MKLGLFGGTFDPVHRGHIAVAIAAAGRFHLDRVLLIPSGFPPHKHAPVGAPYEDRYRMVELACGADSRLEASRLEAPDGSRERHYSVETIERVRAQLSPGDELFFIIGADAFAEISLWKQWQQVIRLVEFIVVSRPEANPGEPPPGTRVHWLNDVRVPVSSTEIRHGLRQGRDLDDALPPTVAQYIRKHELYARKREEDSSGRQAALG